MSIIGKWRTIWSNSGGDLPPDTPQCEYTDSGEFLQEVRFPNGLIKTAVVKCEHLAEGKVRHIIKGREGPKPIDYTYKIGDDGILVITNAYGTWKLIRADRDNPV